MCPDPTEASSAHRGDAPFPPGQAGGAGRPARTLVIGGGGVLGEALCREFAGDGEVVALRRVPDAGPAAAGVRPPWRVRACDLADPAAVERTVAAEVAAHGPIRMLLHNAAHFIAAPFAELELSDFEAAWRVGCAGAVAGTRAALPGMRSAGGGTVILVGATASRRGGARFAALAAAKFALRGFAQALARECQPQGIHVAHLVIDGLVQGSPSIARFGGSAARAIPPVEVARACRWLAAQPPSAWTHELDLRPSTERF